MYYSSGNYEGICHTEKSRKASMKSAYIVGTGLRPCSGVLPDP